MDILIVDMLVLQVLVLYVHGYNIFMLQAYPEIMADMFEAMTRQPAKRQRLNWVQKTIIWPSDCEPNILATSFQEVS